MRLWQTLAMAAGSVLRTALWCSVPLNLLGVIVFGSVAIGRPVMPLPLAAPPFYAAQIALIIGLFGAVYAWLALQPIVNRPLLLVGAIGKIGFFALFVAYWLVGDLPGLAVAQAAPDLGLGAVFLWWLWIDPPAGE
jgi:hypothetical protein